MMQRYSQKVESHSWGQVAVGVGLASAWVLQAACGGSTAATDSEASSTDDASSGDGCVLDGTDGESGGDYAEDRWYEPDIVVPGTCGDGVLDPGEDCDDGNRLNGDECDWACRSGPGDPPVDDPLSEVAESDTLSLLVGSTDIDLDALEPGSLILADRQPLVWTGTHYATVALIEDWDDSPTTSSELQFVKFGRDSVRSGPGWRFHEPGRPFRKVDLVWNGEGFGLVWTNSADSTIWFVELDADGKPVSSVVPLVEGLTARDLSLVWNDGTYGVFWIEGNVPITDETRDALAFLPFDRHGGRTAEPVDVLRSEEPTVLEALDGASSGTTDAVAFLVAEPSSANGSALWAVVSAAGTALSAASCLGPAANHDVAIAWDERSAFGLAWVRSAHDPPLHLARINEHGTLLGPPRPVGEPVSMPPGPFSNIDPTSLSMSWGADGWGIAFPQAPSNPMCLRHAGLVRTDRIGTLTDLVCLDDVLRGTQAFSDVVFDGEAFGWLHNRHDGLRLIRWLVGA